MVKILGAVFIGVVIGAAVGEILKKENPELGKDVYGKIKKGVDALKQAFKDGYAQSTESTPAAEAAPAS